MRKIYILFLILFISGNLLKGQVTDADVKVAYVYRFTEYIDWQQNTSQTFTIGVLAYDELLLNKFKYLAQNREINNRKIEIIPIKNYDQFKNKPLNILFVSVENNANIPEIFELLSAKNTLLITDNCQTKEAVMINFLPSSEKTVRFEVNKKNIVDKNLAMHPDILLLGGSYIEIRKLFQDKEKELEVEKDKLKISKAEVLEQKKILQTQDSIIKVKEIIVANQNFEIQKQTLKLEQQFKELDKLSSEIDEKKVMLNEKLALLREQEAKLIEQQENLRQTKFELDEHRQKLEYQEDEINRQDIILSKQLSKIEFQKNILYIFLTIILLILSLVYFIYRGFKIKKQANIKLEEYNNEILAQNEEILSQREEIVTARDSLREINAELEKLSVVASKTSNAVVITNNFGDIEWVNEGFTKLFGYKIDELTSKFGKNIVSAPFQPLIEEKIKLCNETKKTVEYLALNTTKKGDQLWMHSSMTPILNEKCMVSKLIIIEANINDLKVAEENIKRQKDEIEKQNQELETYRTRLENLVENRTKQLLIEKERAVESEKLKSAFIANMSHEIRTPMNAVIGFSNLLTLADTSPATTTEYIKIINSNAKTLLQLIDDIIDLSRIEAGKLLIKKTDCDINALLDELYMVYKEKIKRENSNVVINLKKQFNTQKFIVFTDKLRVNQVIINLLDNATKFTSEGIIEFGYSMNDESSVQFFVSDTGIGIENENQKIIFERFLKIEDNSKKLYRGAGLGLSICKSIISDLQGEIWVESEIGKGSKFYFTLPYSKEKTTN